MLKSFRSKFSGEILFFVATVSQPAITLLSGLIGVRWLSPAALGTITSAALLPAYLSFLHFGVFTGLARNLPLALGAEQHNRATILEDTSSTVAAYVALVSLLIGVGCSFIAWALTHDSMLFAACVASATACGATHITNYIDIVARARLRFSGVAWAQMSTNGIAILSNALVVTHGMAGAVLRIVLNALIAFGSRLPLRLWHPHAKLDWLEAHALMKTGLPLLVSGTFFSLLMVSDRSVVGLMLGREQLGLFSLASMIVSSLQFLPQSFSLLLFPRMAREYGRTKSSLSLRRLVTINFLLNVGTIIPVCLALYFSIEPMVLHFFPAYESGIPAAKIACISGVFWIYLGVGSVFGVMNRMRGYLITMAIAIVMVWVGGALSIKCGYGILGASYARLGATALVCAYTIGASWFLVTRETGAILTER